MARLPAILKLDASGVGNLLFGRGLEAPPAGLERCREGGFAAKRGVFGLPIETCLENQKLRYPRPRRVHMMYARRQPQGWLVEAVPGQVQRITGGRASGKSHWAASYCIMQG